MAELTIRLVVDPDTRKKNVVIDYHSDEDALPMEHEDEHRRLVDRLIEGGALSAAELGKIVIQREQDSAAAVEVAADEPAEQRGSVARET
jgi:hypothetical protein